MGTSEMRLQLLTTARRAAMAQGAEQLSDEQVGGGVCDRCGQRPGLVSWNPFAQAMLCYTCKGIVTDRELERTRGTAPLQLKSVPPAVTIVRDQLLDEVRVARQELEREIIALEERHG